MKVFYKLLLASLLLYSCSESPLQNKIAELDHLLAQSKDYTARFEAGAVPFRDSLKNDSMTATFINSVSGATEDITMKKSGETDDSFIYTCEADTNLYNMVHLNYGNKLYDNPVDAEAFARFAAWSAETPEDYDAKSAEKYSTIYTFDGQSVLAKGTDRGMDNDKESWNVSESVRGMMSVTDNKAIVVAIVTDGDTRENELFPDLGELYNDPEMPEEYKLKSDKSGNKFADFVCDTVMPYIQKNYNVYTDAQHNALVGSSLGGLETFYTVLAHPDKFGTGGVMSATFTVYDDAVWDSFLSDKIKMENAPFIYFYAGSYGFDNGDVTMKMYNKLTEKGYPQDKFVYNKYEHGTHLMVYWRNIFSEFLQAVFTQKVEALEFGAKIDYADKTDMRTQSVTEIKIDENDPRLLDKNNYVYYDNSETKWEDVYAFWWSDDGFSKNIISGGFYEAGWPGLKMEQIKGTDIYRIIAPEDAAYIIFDSGVTDEEVRKGKTAYQTRDIIYRSSENTGKVFKIDMKQKAQARKGIEKTKFIYPEGTWSEYKE